MVMVCASTYLYLLQFLSSVSYNFLSTGLLHPRYFILFEAIVNGIVLLISFSVRLLLVYKKCTWFLCINFVSCYFAEFIYQFLQFLDWICGSICTVSCHLQMMTVVPFPFQFGCLLFLLLVWLLWPGLPVLCWIREVKVDIPVLFLISKGALVVFACWVCCWQWVCCIWPLLSSVMFPLFPHCWEFFFLS